MNRIAQEAGRRKGVVKHAEKHGKSKAARRYPELSKPGEKVQIDAKEVPYHCLKGAAKRDGKHLYQWTAIDECTRLRLYMAMRNTFQKTQLTSWSSCFGPFPSRAGLCTDNGTEFICRLISDKERCPFEEALAAKEISHERIPPRTPWHNGKLERSHNRSGPRYFFGWEKFADVHELNQKLRTLLSWYNEKPMHSLDWCSSLLCLTSSTGSHRGSLLD